ARRGHAPGTALSCRPRAAPASAGFWRRTKTTLWQRTGTHPPTQSATCGCGRAGERRPGVLGQLRDLALHLVSLQGLGHGNGRTDPARGKEPAHGSSSAWPSSRVTITRNAHRLAATPSRALAQGHVGEFFARWPVGAHRARLG